MLTIILDIGNFLLSLLKTIGTLAANKTYKRTIGLNNYLKPYKAQQKFIDKHMKLLRVKVKSGRAYLMALYDNNKEHVYYGIRNSKLSIVSESVDEDNNVSKEFDNFQDVPLALFDSSKRPSVIDHLTWESDFGIIFADGIIRNLKDEIINTNPVMLHELRRQGNTIQFLLVLRQFERPHSVIGVDYTKTVDLKYDESIIAAIKADMTNTGNEINRIKFI